jgi:hypothetical protein
MARNYINEAHMLERNKVQVISYHCATPGPETQEGTIVGFWTGETDSWGKRTIQQVNAGHARFYLFDEEIVSVNKY